MSPMLRSVAIYGGLLALSLGAAWVKWTSEPAPDLDGKVVLLQGEVDQIASVEWIAEDDQTLIERKEDAHGAYYWVTHTRTEQILAPAESAKDAHEGEHGEDEEHGPEEAPEEGEAAEGDEAEEAAEEAPPPEPETKTIVMKFKAGENGDSLMTDLSPLLAIRRLDSIPEDKRETVGLDEATEKVVINRRGRTATLTLGGEVYGTRDRYVRHEETGEVFLVDDQILRPLKYARTRLPDRTVFSLEGKAIASVVIAGADGQSLEATHKNAQDQAKAEWAVGDEAPQQLQTWMDKALKLKSTRYADDEDGPEGELEARFQLSLVGTDGKKETLEVFQASESEDWWGKSEHTRGLVKLLGGPTSTLSDDVGAVTANTGESAEPSEG